MHVGIHDVAACRTCSSQGISVCKKNTGLCCQFFVTFTFVLNACFQAVDAGAVMSDLQSIVSAGLLVCHFHMHPIQLLLILAFGVLVVVDEMDREFYPWFQLHFRASQLHAMCPLVELYVFLLCFGPLPFFPLLCLPVAFCQMLPSRSKRMLNFIVASLASKWRTQVFCCWWCVVLPGTSQHVSKRCLGCTKHVGLKTPLSHNGSQ